LISSPSKSSVATDHPRQAVFVIVRGPSGRVLVHDVACRFMTDDAFRAKVLIRSGRKGGYLWAPNARVAIEEFGAVFCKQPEEPV
jgi:hypothetical protein